MIYRARNVGRILMLLIRELSESTRTSSLDLNFGNVSRWQKQEKNGKA